MFPRKEQNRPPVPHVTTWVHLVRPKSCPVPHFSLQLSTIWGLIHAQNHRLCPVYYPNLPAFGSRTMPGALRHSSRTRHQSCPQLNDPRAAALSKQEAWRISRTHPGKRLVPHSDRIPDAKQSPVACEPATKCGRKPQGVVVSLLVGEQERDSVSLKFPADFDQPDPSDYVVRSEVVLEDSH